jgi:hypothetical protein
MRALSASNTSICTSIKLIVMVVVDSQARRASPAAYLYTASCGDGAEQTCKKWHGKKNNPVRITDAVPAEANQPFDQR